MKELKYKAFVSDKLSRLSAEQEMVLFVNRRDIKQQDILSVNYPYCDGGTRIVLYYYD